MSKVRSTTQTSENSETQPSLIQAPSAASLVRSALTTGLVAFAFAGSSLLHAEEVKPAKKDEKTVSLDKTVVSEKSDELVPADITTAAQTLTSIAGSVSLADSKVFEKGRVGTAADILAFQPGVFAQSTGGQDALRVSIRGSGINRGQGSFREGITFLFDGLPLTGPGGSPYELFEPLGVSYTEILRGANASTYGGVALGGAINYVTKTGYDASRYELRLELGSFGYHKVQLASGGVFGNKDYYATVVASERGGFQKLTKGYSLRAIANIGVRINDRTSNRFFVRYGATGFENAGNITLAQLLTDPTQANTLNVAQSKVPGSLNYRLQQGSTWVGDKLTFKPDADTTTEFGLVLHDYPIDIQASTSRSLWDHDDIAFSGRYISTKDLAGYKNKLTAGFQTSTEIIGWVTTYTNNSLAVETQRRTYSGSGNYVAYINDELHLNPKLAITADAKLSYIHREAHYTYVHPGLTQQNLLTPYHHDAGAVAPRVGLRYDHSKEVSFFANVSRAVEPADSWKYNQIRNSAVTNTRVDPWTDYYEQVADTIEAGAQYKNDVVNASVTLYRSWLSHELLTVQDLTNPNFRLNINSTSGTYHQGAEAALTTLLWQEGGLHAKVKDGNAHRISFRNAYTFNDFGYRGDALFGNNELPGLPRQFYQGEIQYEHPSGFYAGVSTQISSSYFVDYDNTFEAPSYTIYNAKLGYASRKQNWEVYLDFKNLTNEAYVTAVTPAYTTRALNAQNIPTGPGRDAAVFQPGDGFSVFAGFSIKL